MTDRNKRILLGAVIFSILALFCWLSYKNCGGDFERQTAQIEQKIEENKQKLQEQKKVTQKTVSNYKAIVKANDKAIKEAVTATIQDTCNETDAEILLDFAELIERAKKYNAQSQSRIDY